MNILIIGQVIRQKFEANSITTRLLAKELANKNTVTIIANYLGEKAPRYEKIGNAEIYRRFRFPIPKSYKNPFITLEFILSPLLGYLYVKRKKKIRYDVIISISSNTFLTLPALIIKSLFAWRIKTIHVFKSRSRYTYLKSMFRLCNRFDAIIVTSESLKKYYHENGVKLEKIHVISSMADLDKFKPLDRKKVRLENGFKDTDKILLYYGHFYPYKGVEILIKSIKHLKTKDVKVILIPSGDEQKHNYDKIIASEYQTGKIAILPSQTDVVEYINIADCVVLPYPELISTEANPLCLIESMHCKTPVVTTDLPEINEIVRDNESAILAKPNDPADLARRIDGVLEDEKLQKKISENGYKIAKRFEIGKVSLEYEKFIEKIVKKEN